MHSNFMWKGGKHSVNLWVAGTWKQWDFRPIESEKTEGIPWQKLVIMIFLFLSLVNVLRFQPRIFTFFPWFSPIPLEGLGKGLCGCELPAEIKAWQHHRHLLVPPSPWPGEGTQTVRAVAGSTFPWTNAHTLYLNQRCELSHLMFVL